MNEARHLGWLWITAAMGITVLLGATVPSQPLVVLGGIGVALAGVMFAYRPDWLSIVVIALLYSNAVVVLSKVHNVTELVGMSVVLTLLLPLSHRLFVRREPVVFTPALPWLVGFFTVQVIGTILSGDPGHSAFRLLIFVFEGVCLYFVVTNVICDATSLRRCAWTILVVGGLLGGLSLFQTITSTHDNDYLGFAQVKDESIEQREQDPSIERPPPRVAGPVGEKNRYAQIMVVLIPIGLLITRGADVSPFSRVAAGTLTALIVIGAALTFSRGAAVGLLLVLGLMALFRQLSLRDVALLALGLMLIVSVFPRWSERIDTLAAVPGVFGESDVAQDPDGSTLGRLGANLAALRVFVEHPIVGVGPGMFPSHYREHAIEVGLRVADGSRAAHNLYLHIAAETGLLGLLFFGGVFYATLRDLNRARSRLRKSDPRLAALATGFMFATVAYLTTGLFLHLSYQRYLWLLLALAGAAGSIARRSHESAEAPQTEALHLTGPRGDM